MKTYYTDKVIIITGASSGIGEALAKTLAPMRCKLILAARSVDKLENIAQVCEKLGSKCLVVSCDVSKKESCENLIQETVKNFGKIDVLINNAGISMRALFQDCSLDDFEKVMNINFWGTVYCTKFALPWLLQSKGHIIGMSSIAGFRGLPARSGYSSSKFAMNGFLESLRTELLHSGVHVLTACPGFTASNIRKAALNGKGQAQDESPLDEAKMMSAEEVAEKILYANEKRKRTLILTTQGKMTVFFNKWLGKWMDKMVFNHFAKEPNSPLKK
jgi:short-subunit dehydrogenase